MFFGIEHRIFLLNRAEMTTFISERANRIRPSASIAAREIAERLKREGRTIYDFTVGEPDFKTPPHIAAAAVRAIEQGATKYTSSSGLMELKNAIQARLLVDYKASFTVDELVIGTGAKQLIFEAFAATLNDDDEVLIPAPYWVSYPEMVAASGGSSTILPCDRTQAFKLQPEQLTNAIGPRTKWLVLNSPNNPSGAVYSKEELACLGQVLQEHPQVWVLSDEIYRALVYDGKKAFSLIQTVPELRSRHLLINGVSKAYAMTGWRIGYAAGPKALIDVIVKLISQSTTCPSAVSQWAAVEALVAGQECIEQMRAEYEGRRTLLCRQLAAIEGVDVDAPEGAFYVFASVAGLIGKQLPNGKTLETDEQIALYMLESAGVATVSGSAYGLEPYLRFSFSTSESTIIDGTNSLQKAVMRLR